MSTICKLSCECPSFIYEFEVILNKFDALYGEPHSIRLPKKAKPIFICKHLHGISTGDAGSLVSTNGKILLAIGRMYKIPIDSNQNLDDHNVFKSIGKISEIMDIRNIEDGVATIIPLLHDTVIIKDNMELGSFI